MGMKEDLWAVATATGKIAVVGVRGYKDEHSWFATCGDIETDASSPEAAARDLRALVRAKLAGDVADAARTESAAKAALGRLA